MGSPAIWCGAATLLCLIPASAVHRGAASDPAYAQEHAQVFNARLRAVVAVSCTSAPASAALAPAATVAARVYLAALTRVSFMSIDIHWCPTWPAPPANVFRNASVHTVAGAWTSRAVETDVFIVIDGGGGGDGGESGGKLLASTAVAAKLAVYHSVTNDVTAETVFRRATALNESSLHPALRFDVVVFPSSKGTLAFVDAWARFYHESDRRVALMLRPPQVLAWPPSQPPSSPSPLLQPQAAVLPLAALDAAIFQTERLVIDGVIGSVFRRFIRHPRVAQAVRRLPVYGAPVATLQKAGGAHQRSEAHARRYAAVIVEPRFEGALEFCVRNVLAHLPPGPHWMLQMHHSTGPLGNELYIKRALTLSLAPLAQQHQHQHQHQHQDAHLLQAARIEFVPIAAAVSDGDSYNHLVRSVAFWQQLWQRNIEKVLLFQTDSVMLRGNRADDWSRFMRFDYVGAPWHLVPGAESATWLRDKQRGGVLRNGVGNGGFSLRSVDTMLYIAKEYGNSNFARRNNEDSFFAHHCEKLDAGLLSARRACLLPDRTTASAFAVEVPCPDVNYTLGPGPHVLTPLGLHNTWAYVDPALSRQLLQQSMEIVMDESQYPHSSWTRRRSVHHKGSGKDDRSTPKTLGS